MKLKNVTFWFAVWLLGTTTHSARADLGYWSAALVGVWNHPTNGDVYHFNSDATYTFYKFRKNLKRDGVVSHSGWWKIYDPGRKIVPGPHGPVGLRLKARRRTIIQGGKRRTLKTNRVFELLVNTPFDGDDNDSQRGRFYEINGVKWVRMR